MADYTNIPGLLNLKIVQGDEIDYLLGLLGNSTTEETIAFINEE